MDYLFRKAIRDDFREVTALFKEAIQNMIDHKIHQWDEIYPDEAILSEDIDKGEMYLLLHEKQLISCIVVNEEQDELYQSGSWKYTDKNIAVIHRLCVHPRAQGNGNGKKTLQFTEKMIKDLGYAGIRLDAFTQNNAAIHMYESVGYSHAGEITFRKGQFYLFEKAI